jgi:hypothetical protein
MNTTHILTDKENDIGKIYLISNRTHGYYTILPFVESNFLNFLEELYSDIEVDDYEISYKYILDVNVKNKIVSYLHNIFNSNKLTFAINNKINASNDFFINLDHLLVNYINNNELLKKFKLLEITDTLKASSSVVEQVVVVEQLTDELRNKDKETILPYNHYEINIPNTISPSIDITVVPIQYFSWKTEELSENSNIFLNCTVLYCVSQNIGIVIENQNIIFVEYLIKNFKDFELVKSYSKLDRKEFDNIKNYFHKRTFENNDTIFKKINSFEFLFDINNDKKNNKVSNEIEVFIRERYILNDEPKNMIKANEILDQLMLELQYFNKDKMKISKELSSILLSIGVKKKRMADGIYYFGIVSKHNLLRHNLFLSSGGNIEEMYKKTVEEHKLESISEILKRLKFQSDCKNKSGPCNCVDLKGCNRVVVPKLHESFIDNTSKNDNQIAM